MRVELIEFISGDGVVETDGTIVECDEKGFVEVEPDYISGVDAFAIGTFWELNFQAGSVGISAGVVVFGNVVDGYLGIVIYEGVGDGGKHVGAISPGGSADGSMVSEDFEAFSRFAIPKAGSAVEFWRKLN